MILASFFAVLGSVAFVCSIIVDQMVQNAMIELLPPQFRDSLSSRYAFDVYVLSPSTPLTLQTKHMKALMGFWFSVLCFALFSIFFFEQAWARWLPSVLVLVMTASTVKSWKAYKANCNRRTIASDKEEP